MLKYLRSSFWYQLHRSLWVIVLLLTACSNTDVVDSAESGVEYQQSVAAVSYTHLTLPTKA